MNKRILLAGLLGGVALFAWGSFSHIVLRLPSIGIEDFPQAQEEGVKSVLSGALTHPGFYFFPGMGEAPGMSAQERSAANKAFEAKYKRGPHGILIFEPAGADVMTPKQLIIQFVLVVVEALLAAWLLSLTTLTSFASRVGFVVGLGVLMALATNVEYWDWYGFPGNYTAAYMLDKVIGMLIVGLVVAAMTRKRMAAPVLQTTRAA
ncbi:MAG TPA: hypothetical protein VH088_21575 [Terriglobales bacterium]|jgi:hypothetical protein|nr:hypothetical protein [Terriglobales bacterium]